MYGTSPNVDGDYHTARRDPLLRASGIATLDASKYYPVGPKILADVLRRADSLSLRWVFVNDDWYYPYLLQSGFDLQEVWSNGVTLFERPQVPAIRQPPALAKTWGDYSWGSLPLFFLSLSILLAILPLALGSR